MSTDFWLCFGVCTPALIGVILTVGKLESILFILIILGSILALNALKGNE